MSRELPITLVRGGTAKAIFIKKEDLPEGREEWNEIFLNLIGSTYEDQIDALGSRFPILTKIAVISKSSDPDVDIEYEFFQVGLEERKVTNRGSCGNLPSALGVFTVEEGYIRPIEPITPVVIRNLNTQKLIKVEVPVKERSVRKEGQYRIDGVRGSGPRLGITFYDVQGALTGRLFPSGNRKDILSEGVPVTIIDAGILAVLIEARYLGLRGTEHPEVIEKNKEVLEKVERIRKEVAGLIDFEVDMFLPKFIYVSAPKNYTTISKRTINSDEIDIIARYFSQEGLIHRSFAVAGGIALASASLFEGTVISEVLEPSSGTIKIGHPSGILEVWAKAVGEEDSVRIDAKLSRTARKILSGKAYIP